MPIITLCLIAGRVVLADRQQCCGRREQQRTENQLDGGGHRRKGRNSNWTLTNRLEDERTTRNAPMTKVDQMSSTTGGNVIPRRSTRVRSDVKYDIIGTQ